MATTGVNGDLAHSAGRTGPIAAAALSVAPLLVLFTALAVVMTWPQARLIATHAVDHQDVYFNLWRLAWFAHALASAPARIFHGNIFHPEPYALTFSDAMVFEGLVAAPLLWAGVPPMLVHNALLLGAIIASAFGMYVLARRLTENRAASVAAAIIFAFAPYRFEHYMHMELQWTVWMPWAFWAVHRTIETGRWAHGLQAGMFIALQMLSSVYYGIFLATILPLLAGLLLLSLNRRRALRAGRSLALGGVAAAIVCSLYAWPYLAASERVGRRSPDEVAAFSARPYDYLVATPDNRLYGDLFLGRGERRLFPGTLALLLALVGLLLRPPTLSGLVYLVTAVAAFEFSLGLHGYGYRFLYEHVPLFSGLRVPARFGIFVVMSLAVLAAYGCAALSEAVPRKARRLLPVLVCLGLVIEYSVKPLSLVAYENASPLVYEFLARLPRGVVAEFPSAAADALPGPDPRYAYMSTFHWKPLINGYSGYYPRSYLRRLGDLETFPDADSLTALRRAGVNYVVVHLSAHEPDTVPRVLIDLQRHPELRLLGRFPDGVGMALVYRLD